MRISSPTRSSRLSLIPTNAASRLPRVLIPSISLCSATPNTIAITLKLEYDRDVAKGIDIKVPKSYYPNDDPSQDPIVSWRAEGQLIYTNWLNYYVYQTTPYDLGTL